MANENLHNCLAIRAVFHIQAVFNLIKNVKTGQKVWMNELFATDIEKMTRAHMILLMFTSSRDLISKQEFKDSKLTEVLELINKMFAVKQIMASHSALYETGFFRKGSNLLLEEAFKNLLV